MKFSLAVVALVASLGPSIWALPVSDTSGAATRVEAGTPKTHMGPVVKPPPVLPDPKWPGPGRTPPRGPVRGPGTPASPASPAARLGRRGLNGGPPKSLPQPPKDFNAPPPPEHPSAVAEPDTFYAPTLPRLKYPGTPVSPAFPAARLGRRGLNGGPPKSLPQPPKDINAPPPPEHPSAVADPNSHVRTFPGLTGPPRGPESFRPLNKVNSGLGGAPEDPETDKVEDVAPSSPDAVDDEDIEPTDEDASIKLQARSPMQRTPPGSGKMLRGPGIPDESHKLQRAKDPSESGNNNNSQNQQQTSGPGQTTNSKNNNQNQNQNQMQQQMQQMQETQQQIQMQNQIQNQQQQQTNGRPDMNKKNDGDGGEGGDRSRAGETSNKNVGGGGGPSDATGSKPDQGVPVTGKPDTVSVGGGASSKLHARSYGKSQSKATARKVESNPKTGPGHRLLPGRVTGQPDRQRGPDAPGYRQRPGGPGSAPPVNGPVTGLPMPDQENAPDSPSPAGQGPPGSSPGGQTPASQPDTPDAPSSEGQTSPQAPPRGPPARGEPGSGPGKTQPASQGASPYSPGQSPQQAPPTQGAAW